MRNWGKCSIRYFESEFMSIAPAGEARKQTTCLVTGGAGFIGSHVADCLLAQGDRVVGLDDLSGGFRENCPVEATLVVGSVLDHTLLADLFSTYQFDYVFHLAAYAAEGLSHFIRRFNYSNNVVGSVNLINEAIKSEVRCFVYTSSIAVYGSRGASLTEEMFPMPEDPYGVAKFAVEMDLHAAQQMFGLNSVIFRPHNVYGERQNIADRYRNVVGIFMNQILRGEPMTIFGDGQQTRCFSYIRDVAPIIASSVSSESAINQTINIGSDIPTSLNELAGLVADAMGTPSVVRHLEWRNEVKHAVAGHQKLAEIFNYQSRWRLTEGLKSMAAWAKAHGACAPSRFSAIEVERNLPPSWHA